jgi:hypothetical protein
VARTARLAYWVKARDSPTRGNAGIEKVAAAYPASPDSRPDPTAQLGIQMLEKANAAIAKLSP